jgi:hypothetical protein
MLKKWNIELIADAALGMYHSWAGHTARLPKTHFLQPRQRLVDLDDGQRKLEEFGPQFCQWTMWGIWPG